MTNALQAAEAGDAAALAAVLRSLSTPARLTIFRVLSEPHTVPELRAVLRLEPDYALSILASAGLVEQLPGVNPRPWRQVADARARLARLLA